MIMILTCYFADVLIEETNTR